MPAIRTFWHIFEPAAANPINGDIADLSVDEIEDAGVREVLQTPGAALGSWEVLDALLEPLGSGSPFVFREPLGQAREVRVALSGLFGRFVARAYLERYFGLSIFAHLGQREIILDGKLQIQVQRRSNGKGDLPDWIACDAGLSNLIVAEAKGCHSDSGPQQALARAWKQAKRIDILVGSRKVPLKRLAIAIRWGLAKGGPAAPILSVRDPDEEGNVSHSEREAALVGVARLHAANLLDSLGQAALASTLRHLVVARDASLNEAAAAAQQALNATRSHRILGDRPASLPDGLLGNWVTKAGPIRQVENLSPEDQRSLRRLDFRPMFVGVERQFVEALIVGDPVAIRESVSQARQPDGAVRSDGAGSWMVRVGEGTLLE